MDREARARARKERMDAAEKKRKRPENVNREVFALLGDQDPQMVPADAEAEPEAGEAKKRPRLDRPVDKWIWHQFENPAREDQFQLAHWTKEKESDEPYQFARFNRKAQVITYTDDEYKQHIVPHDTKRRTEWTRQETDCLFDLCERFQLKFIVIADRYLQEL